MNIILYIGSRVVTKDMTPEKPSTKPTNNKRKNTVMDSDDYNDSPVLKNKIYISDKDDDKNKMKCESSDEDNFPIHERSDFRKRKNKYQKNGIDVNNKENDNTNSITTNKNSIIDIKVRYFFHDF